MELTLSDVCNIARKELGGLPKIYIWDGEEPNPDVGHLAWADAFIVTADSVSMLSETCSTGKPVYVVGAERCKWKFVEFHKTLRERGLVRPLTGLEDNALLEEVLRRIAYSSLSQMTLWSNLAQAATFEFYPFDLAGIRLLLEELFCNNAFYLQFL